MRRKRTMYGWTLGFVLMLSAAGQTLFAQAESPCDYRATYLYWVGGSSNDFFDEGNWREANRKNDMPETGTICRPGMVQKQHAFLIFKRSTGAKIFQFNL